MNGAQSAWDLLVGDPTPLGWLAFLAYLLAAGACWRAYRAASVSAARRQAWFWALFALLFFVLGLNKQLDLQTALLRAGRALVHSGRAPLTRGEASVYGIFAMAVGGGLALYLLARLAWPPGAGQGLALAGCACLVGYVLMRLSDFQHVPIFLGAPVLAWSWAVEFAAIGLVAAGAARRLCRQGRARP